MDTSSSSLSGLENLVATLRRTVKPGHEGARSRAVLHQYQEKLKAKKARRSRSKSKAKGKKEKKRLRSRSRSRSPSRRPVSRGLMSRRFNEKFMKPRSRSKSPKPTRRTHASRREAMLRNAQARDEKDVVAALLLLGKHKHP